MVINQLLTLDETENTLDETGNTPDERKNTLDETKNTPDECMDRRRNSAEYILDFCITPRRILEISEFLGYKEKKSVRKHIKPLLEQGRLAMTLPDRPNSKNQKYITIK